ncbi:hypothetical protein YC2023_074655 [Brassica napus]|uniref:(rape) hypothetical protein n=1 Tax=Brassica napus TaxID=3708 RepID=A0A816TFC8_BRANA|nr:unnamed protein product [Brassica napus]
MSLLCKKPKSGRLSRFMSEFHQSPKRGGIMVVETGFPTSLVDLFFKNRDRLKKRESRNASRSKIEKVSFVGSQKHTSDNNVCVCGDGTGAFVLMAFKLFIVAVLALSTPKSLTMGVTLCAFALLFTENVATRILTRFKLCNTDVRKEKPLASTHGDRLISCSEETETIGVTKNSNSDEKTRSKSSRLKSKILKKLRSYKKKKDKTIVIEEEILTDVSSVEDSERDEEKSNQPLIESKGDNMDGTVVIVIVLTGLLSGKIAAIGLTLSCLYLGFGATKRSGFCK